MKIVFLCDKQHYLTKMSRVRFHGIRALEELANVVFTGNNWDGYNANLPVQENFDKLDLTPDIVIGYKPLEHKEFYNTKALRCLRYNEMFDTNWTMHEIKESRANLIVCHHYNDMLEYKHLELQSVFPCKLVNIPHCAESSIFRPMSDIEKKWDLLLVGAIDTRTPTDGKYHYPLRRRMREILKKMPSNFKCGIHEHPGGTHSDAYTDKYQIEFAKAINSTKLAITCSGRPNSRFGKYVEIPMCGTGIVADMPGEQQEQFKKFLIEIHPDMSDGAIISKMIYFLANEEALKTVIDNGLEYALQYTQESYANKLANEFDLILKEYK